MSMPVKPNPYSPYATADMDLRHFVAVPFFLPDPSPGELVPTGCHRFAVVPTDVVEIDPAAIDQPSGSCDACWRAANSGGAWQPPRLPATTCGTCTLPSDQGATCALCRVEAHRTWWARTAGAR